MPYVYWVKTKDITDTSDGYIGVTSKEPSFRLEQHNKRGRFCKYANKEDLQQIILFEGSMEECFEQETIYRPNIRMGWNICVGGTGGNSGNSYVAKNGCPWMHKINATRREKFKTGKLIIHNRKDYSIQHIETKEIFKCGGIHAVAKLIGRSVPTALKFVSGLEIRNCKFIKL